MSVRPSGVPLEFVFPPNVERLRTVRQDVRRQLGEIGVGDDTADNVMLVIDELVNNAIEHAAAYRVADAILVLRLRAVDEHVALEFEDPDVPHDVVADLWRRVEASRQGPPPPLDSERGRGLFLIADFVEELKIRSLPAGGMQLQGRLA